MSARPRPSGPKPTGQERRPSFWAILYAFLGATTADRASTECPARVSCCGRSPGCRPLFAWARCGRLPACLPARPPARPLKPPLAGQQEATISLRPDLIYCTIGTMDVYFPFLIHFWPRELAAAAAASSLVAGGSGRTGINI